ncbi:hypothetical protein K438DRAFT_1852098 [Mycena galopus ATCC 62051]|nr:hypothetical protein K438DRAFT_1852098 [Mycena galopus ATCC 62051]
MGLVDMDARVSKFSKDLEDGLSGVHARVVGLAADMAEGGRTTEDPYAMSTVVSALNTHTANGNALADAIRAVQGRIAELEKMPAAITSIQASLDAVHNTLRVVLSRTSASTGSAPPAPTAAEAVVINANGKRVHDADGVDDAAKRQHLAITAPTPFSLPTAPPPPGYAAPAFAAPAPLLPAPFVPAAAAPMPALIAPAPVPAHPFAVATIAPTALPTVPAPLPRAPPAGAPRVPPNPAREVLFGPMNWEKKWNRNPHNLIMNTLGPNTMRGVHFSSRRGADDDTVIVVFEAETVANWFVTTWNASSRLGYEICTARPQSLNV